VENTGSRGDGKESDTGLRLVIFNIIRCTIIQFLPN
jgi:hypothetical protein